MIIFTKQNVDKTVQEPRKHDNMKSLITMCICLLKIRMSCLLART